MSKLAQGRLCVIHNNVAEASVKLEVSEQRVVAYLTSLISKNDQDFKVYPIAVKDLAKIIGVASSNLYQTVENTTKNLAKKVMTLRRLDGPGKLQVAWLSSAEYKDGEGIVELEFSPKLKPYLLQLKEHFTKYPLKDVIRFKSQFSMPIYLLLKQYLTVGYRQFAIEELREKLALGNQYAQYGHFKNRVLNAVMKEINEKSSIDIDFSEVREGRKVVAVRFTMKSKPQKPADVDMFEQLPAAPEEQAAAVAPDPAPVSNADLIADLSVIGIKEQKAVELIKAYTAQAVKDMLASSHAEKKRLANTPYPMKSQAGWVISALKRGFDDRLAAQKAEQARKEEATKKAAEREAALLAEFNAQDEESAATLSPEFQAIADRMKSYASKGREN